jgi:hypothetical protein
MLKNTYSRSSCSWTVNVRLFDAATLRFTPYVELGSDLLAVRAVVRFSATGVRRQTAKPTTHLVVEKMIEDRSSPSGSGASTQSLCGRTELARFEKNPYRYGRDPRTAGPCSLPEVHRLGAIAAIGSWRAG